VTSLTDPTIEQQISFLLSHGWKRRPRKSGHESATEWVSPTGGIYRGPHFAYVWALLAGRVDDSVRRNYKCGS
jgi:hypothetical protein